METDGYGRALHDIPGKPIPFLRSHPNAADKHEDPVPKSTPRIQTCDDTLLTPFEDLPFRSSVLPPASPRKLPYADRNLKTHELLLVSPVLAQAQNPNELENLEPKKVDRSRRNIQKQGKEEGKGVKEERRFSYGPYSPLGSSPFAHSPPEGQTDGHEGNWKDAVDLKHTREDVIFKNVKRVSAFRARTMTTRPLLLPRGGKVEINTGVGKGEKRCGYEVASPGCESPLARRFDSGKKDCNVARCVEELTLCDKKKEETDEDEEQDVVSYRSRKRKPSSVAASVVSSSQT